MAGVGKHNKVMNAIGFFLDKVNRAVEAFSTVILFFAVFVVLLQIFFRLFLDKGGAVRWVWESIILINVWLTYLGASVLAKEEKNISLRAYERLPLSMQPFFRQLVRIIILAVSIMVVMQAYKLMLRQLRSPFVTIPFLSRGHGTMVIVIGFSLIAVYALFHLLNGSVGTTDDTEKEEE